MTIDMSLLTDFNKILIKRWESDGYTGEQLKIIDYISDTATQGDLVDAKEVYDLINESDDKTSVYEKVGHYLVVHSDMLESALCDYLSGDDEAIAMFSADVLSDVLGVDSEIIEVLHDNVRNDLIGQWVRKANKVMALAKEVANYETYNCLSSNGEFEECDIAGQTYTIFNKK